MSAILGRSQGLGASDHRIRSRAPRLTLGLSGNSYAFARMRLYVAWTSDVWNGGVPTKSVYMMTPMDHTSTSYEWPLPLEPASTSGAM